MTSAIIYDRQNFTFAVVGGQSPKQTWFTDHSEPGILREDGFYKLDSDSILLINLLELVNLATVDTIHFRGDMTVLKRT